MFKKEYYLQIEGKAEQSNNEEQYVYNLNGFDENRNEKVVSFFVNNPYEERTLVRVPRSLEGYTGSPKVIEMNELTKELKKNFNL